MPWRSMILSVIRNNPRVAQGTSRRTLGLISKSVILWEERDVGVGSLQNGASGGGIGKRCSDT